MPLSPSLADRTLTPQNRVEEDETEHAVDVEEDECQYDENENCQENQSEELGDVGGDVAGAQTTEGGGQFRGRQKLMAGTGRVWVQARKVETAEVAAAEVQFRRENSDQRQARPLSPAKRFEELLTGVLQGGLYAINGGERHEHPSICRQGIVRRVMRQWGGFLPLSVHS